MEDQRLRFAHKAIFDTRSSILHLRSSPSVLGWFTCPEKKQDRSFRLGHL